MAALTLLKGSRVLILWYTKRKESKNRRLRKKPERRNKMPLKRCKSDKKPGWKYGDSGACYTYIAGNEKSEAAAKLKASKQGIAISRESGEKFKP